jgi:hypothetical protein
MFLPECERSCFLPIKNNSQGSSPGRGEIFRTQPDCSWGPPRLLYKGYWIFPGGKVTGAWCWPPTPSSAGVKWVYSYNSTPSGLLSLLQCTYNFYKTTSKIIVLYILIFTFLEAKCKKKILHWMIGNISCLEFADFSTNTYNIKL